MIAKIQQLGRGQRIVVFFSIFIGGLMLLVALTILLISFSINSSPRNIAQGVTEGVIVREFATLPDDDAYPSAIAVGNDGTVYTGSYQSGTVWAILPSGEVRELPETRILIASVGSIEVAEDGTLYILDRTNANIAAKGGLIWRILPNGTPQEFATIFDGQDGFIAPYDLALADDGTLYATDRGRREVWKFDSEGNGEFWWSVPNSDPQQANSLPTSIDYDASTDTLVIVVTNNDPNKNIVVDNLYRVSRDGETTDNLYRYSGALIDAPGFSGISISPEGRIFLANLSQNGVSEFIRNDYSLLARGFRGSSALDYYDGKLYVNNFDQVALGSPLVQPRLPFGIDEVTLPD